ncbi:hypothetical protein JRQ81_013872, partial [Phrynocephalus forsythii]
MRSKPNTVQCKCKNRRYFYKQGFVCSMISPWSIKFISSSSLQQLFPVWLGIVKLELLNLL